MWKLNTSNLDKYKEFKQLFSQYGQTLECSSLDLKEIDATPVEVIVHKASQMGENILVDDTSLEVEGTSIGINVRWLLNHLPDCIGRRAAWTVLLAYRRETHVFIYKGYVPGKIVKPKGASNFGFDPVFLPDGAHQTLAESKPDNFNARAKAIENLMIGNSWMSQPIIEHWNGPWQAK